MIRKQNKINSLFPLDMVKIVGYRVKKRIQNFQDLVTIKIKKSIIPKNEIKNVNKDILYSRKP